jgi:hypothetical protein
MKIKIAIVYAFILLVAFSATLFYFAYIKLKNTETPVIEIKVESTAIDKDFITNAITTASNISELQKKTSSPCTSNLMEINLNGETFCSLNVPYINQSLNSNGEFTQDPSGRDDVNYMCTAASEIMIAAYYKKITYTDLDNLREHLYMSQSSPELVAGNTIHIGNEAITLCTNGAFGITSYDINTGISECNWNNNIELYPQYLGLHMEQIDTNFTEIKATIDSGMPILMFIAPYDQLAGGIFESHFVVVKGYSLTEEVLLLNDPFSDINTLSDDGLCMGLSASPKLTGENSIFSLNDSACSYANAMYKIY